MKLLYSIFAALVMVSCGSGQMTQTPFAPTTAERMGDMMNYLASNDLKGREAGSEGIEMAAVYIENYFKSYGLTPYFESYRDTLSNFNKPAYNIVGMIKGNDPELKDEFILIGAHYDHIGAVKPENGDAIANGANDNASGTITVLEMARYFGTQKTNKRSLIFALFSAMQDKDYLMYITGYEMSNLAEVSNEYAGENLVGFLPTAKEFNLYQRSDNYPFHEEFGVPSHTFCTFDFTNFAFYHKPGDEAALMDFKHMSTVVNKTIPVIEKIANAASQDIKLN